MNMTAKKHLSQNFLIDDNSVNTIVDIVTSRCKFPIVEIGAGRGALTKLLTKQGIDIHAVEIDKSLVAFLVEQYYPRCTIHQADILEFDLTKLSIQLDTKVRVIGNLPYHITTDIIFSLLRQHSAIESQYLLVQKEYAQRLIAAPNTPQYGRLSVMGSLYYQIRPLFQIDKESFDPIPRVDSLFIQMQPKEIISSDKKAKLEKITRLAFNQRRKKLKNSLLPYLAQLPERYHNLRSDQLTPEDYLLLCEL